MRGLSRLLFLTLGVVSALVLPGGRAHAICFQPVGGVPPVYGQPPQWWIDALPLGSATSRWIDDPRWRGASSYNSLGDFSRFRVLVETVGTQKFLVMSWFVAVDPTAANDRLYVGFYNDPTSEGNVYRLTRVKADASTVAGATFVDAAWSGRAFYRDASTTGLWAPKPGAPPPLPSWLTGDKTRIDVFCTGTTCDSWAIRMRVPIDASAVVSADDPTGIKVTGSQFRFWYEIQDSNAGTLTPVYNWPTGLANATETGGAPPIQFPDPAGWNQVNLAGTCDGEISLAPGQIYANTPGNIQVNLTTPNHFHATPTNNVPTATAPSIEGSSVKARFRLANWGTSIGASVAWSTVCAGAVGTAGAVLSGNQLDIDCGPWTPPDPCAFKPASDPGCSGNPVVGTKNPDQCVLVDLEVAGSTSPARYFSPDSQYQNMLFTGTSKVVKIAMLDTRGLPPPVPPGPMRDLYVYVQTHNMPKEVVPAPGGAGTDNGRPAMQPGLRDRMDKLQIKIPDTGVVGSKEAERIKAAVGAGVLTYADVETIMPTYHVYVWYDTGKTVALEGGGTGKVLQPMPSFGLFAWHDGSLTGWEHHLTAAGAVELGPNYYRIPAPVNGTLSASVSIEALEHQDLLSLLPMWLLVLIILLLILLAVLVVRKLVTGSPAGP